MGIDPSLTPRSLDSNLSVKSSRENKAMASNNISEYNHTYPDPLFVMPPPWGINEVEMFKCSTMENKTPPDDGK
ncbi:hypothetical protein PoB_006232100 [Plakobranchus ocellatus]|uniref:Uncharacterized protein n=1 Tax=Plakobranchus ocellatus TaxID=259542 RepID=A0AAV4CV77_9GAST|nr:hypothetical protein PoB_006232100 [Plakobranchus ocellatus]